jgi:hypothetical protein
MGKLAQIACGEQAITSTLYLAEFGRIPLQTMRALAGESTKQKVPPPLFGISLFEERFCSCHY